jgi:hypothetical protein
VLAIESLLSRASRHQFSLEQKAELKERATDVNKSLGNQATLLYETVMLPTDVGTDGAVSFENVDLGTVMAAGRMVSERVTDALAHHVFSSVTPARLSKLSRLGERGVVPCDEIAGGFFRYFAFTKLWTAQAVRDAIAKGVERGEFAYGVGVTVTDGEARAVDPALVRAEGVLPADEVDLGPEASLLTVEVGRQLSTTGTPDSPMLGVCTA